MANIIEELARPYKHAPGKIELLSGKMLTAEYRTENTPEIEDGDQNLFYENAFLFWDYREDILNDSKLFLTTIAGTSHLAYFGPSWFRRPTLGVFVEWWMTCAWARYTLSDSELGLICNLAGSPLSGMNRCLAIDRAGNHHPVELPMPFTSAWEPFTRINCRYREVKDLYVHYSLEEAVSILSQRKDFDDLPF